MHEFSLNKCNICMTVSDHHAIRSFLRKSGHDCYLIATIFTVYLVNQITDARCDKQWLGPVVTFNPSM